MFLVKYLKVFVLSVLMLFVSLQGAWAIMATASVDENKISLGDTFTVSIEVIGDQSGRYRMPKLSVPGCTILGTSSVSKVIAQNGRVVSTRIYSYVIYPHSAGTVTVPSVRIESEGEYSDTQPITVEVVGGNPQKKKKTSKKSRSSGSQNYDDDEEPGEEYQSAASSSPSRPAQQKSVNSPSSPSLLLTAETDKVSAYPNEQITLTATFYSAIPLEGNPQYTPPTFKNFTSEELPPVRNGQKALEDEGTLYGYSEIKTALFAVSEGKAEISEAVVTANVP
ncbi:MAG: BatD family protein, partial [Elusimicrobiales bacterium]|nr:BatD family protein [Elusimicrobiales bacterium]